MKKSLLVSAAAIVIAGTGASFALPSKESAPERVPAAQRPVPAEKNAPPVTTGQVEPRTLPRDAQVPLGSSRALDEKSETTGQGTPREAAPGQASPAQGSPVRDVTPSSSDKSPSTGAQTSSPTTSQTTGQGAASTSSNLTTEQRTKISSSIRQQVAPLTNVNFSITIGTAIPREIQRAPLPAAVLDVYPAWRGYEFIVVGNEILIIDPPTLRIVAILET